MEAMIELPPALLQEPARASKSDSVGRLLGASSAGFDFVQQIGVTIQHLEQFQQGQGRLGLAVLVAREGIDGTAEEFGGRPRVSWISSAAPLTGHSSQFNPCCRHAPGRMAMA
jgi:hypothetical protein